MGASVPPKELCQIYAKLLLSNYDKVAESSKFDHGSCGLEPLFSTIQFMLCGF